MSRLEAIGDLDTVLLRRYDPDATAVIPIRASYSPVHVPENRSSIPGSGDKKDWGLRLILALLALALFANAAAFAVLCWTLR